MEDNRKVKVTIRDNQGNEAIRECPYKDFLENNIDGKLDDTFGKGNYTVELLSPVTIDENTALYPQKTYRMEGTKGDRSEMRYITGSKFLEAAEKPGNMEALKSLDRFSLYQAESFDDAKMPRAIDEVNGIQKRLVEIDTRLGELDKVSPVGSDGDIPDYDFDTTDSKEKIQAQLRSNEAKDARRKEKAQLQKEKEDLTEKYYTSYYLKKQREEDIQKAKESDKRSAGHYADYMKENARAGAINPVGPMSASTIAEMKAEGGGNAQAIRSATNKLNAETVKVLEAPSRYKSNAFANFGKGMGKTLSDDEFWTMGLSAIERNLALKGVFDKIRNKLGDFDKLTEEDIENKLSPLEQDLLEAYFRNADAQASRATDLSLGYQAGQSAAESLGYMAQFALGTGATKGAITAMEKWLAGKMGLSAMKGFAKATTRGAIKTAGALVQSAGITALQPSMAGNIIKDMNSIQIGEDGKLQDGFSLWRTMLDNYIENLSEMSGGALSATLKGVAKVTGLNRLFSGRLGDAVKTFMHPEKAGGVFKTLKAGGWNGFLEEVGEELVGAAMRKAVNVDENALSDFFKEDNLKVLVASFLPMTMFSGASNTARYLAIKKQYTAARVPFEEQLRKLGFANPEGIANDLANISTLEDSGKNLHLILNSAVQKMRGTGATDKQVNDAVSAIMDYTRLATQMAAYTQINNQQIEDKREMRKQYLEQRYGQFWNGEVEPLEEGLTDDVDDARSVTLVTMNDGTQGFFLGTDGEKTTLKLISEDKNADATNKFVDNADISDERTMPLKEFLDEEGKNEKKFNEGQRMSQEIIEQKKNIKESLVPGSKISLGKDSEGKDIEAEVIEQNADGIIVKNPDGTMAQLGIEQVAELLGRPIQTKTDDQIDAELSDKIALNQQSAKALNHQGVGKTLTISNEEGQTQEVTLNLAEVDENGDLMLHVSDSEGKEMIVPATDVVKGLEEQNDKEVVVSNQEKGISLHPKTQIEESVPLNDPNKPTQTDNQPASLGINSSETTSEGTQNSETEPSNSKEKENGEPLYEEMDAESAWDALVKQAGGDETIAQSVANEMVAEKEKAVEKASKLKSKGGKTITEKIASEKERKEVISNAIHQLEIWKKIASVSLERVQKAEAEQKKADEEAAIARKEEEAKRHKEQETADREKRESLRGVPDVVDDTPQAARDRGYRLVNGHKYERQKPLKALRGKDIEVKFSDDVIVGGKVAVIDVKELQPSHIQRHRNPSFFIDEAQPKERKDEASSLAAEKIAGNIRPEEITSSVTAYTGAPSVNSRGEVIQGNNRGYALYVMWNDSHYKEQAQKYKQYLKDHAAEFGLNPEDVDKIDKPALVNMLDVEDNKAIELGQYVASDTESGGTERIKAKNAMQKMGEKMRVFCELILHSADEDTSLSELIDANGEYTLKWMMENNFISHTQYSSALDSRGNLTAEAKNDLRSILSQTVFVGASNVLEEMFYKMPVKAQRAILATAYRDNDSPEADRMLGEVQDSIRAFYYLMQDKDFIDAKDFENARLAIEHWKRQLVFDFATGESFLPAENFSNFALILAALYKGETQSRIQEKFKRLYDIIQGKLEDTLFEEADKTPKTLAEAIKIELNIDYDGKKRSNVLADNTSAGQQGQRDGQGTTSPGGRGKEEAQPAVSETGARGVRREREESGNNEELKGGQKKGEDVGIEKKNNIGLVGDFGPIYNQFKGKPKEAIRHLKKMRNGEAIAALSHREIGDIDLIWGEEGTGHSDGFGLAKLVKHHPEVVDRLQEILDDTVVSKRSENRVQLESERYQVSVRLTWNGKAKKWLLTAFEKKETYEPAISRTDVESNLISKSDDTATRQDQNVSSSDKGSENREGSQEGGQNNLDPQGNIIDANGRLITEKIASIDDLTDEDFTSPTRSVELPELPQNVQDAIGTDGKPVIIKKNIFEKNLKSHKDLSPRDSREILKQSLFNADLYGQNQKTTRPYNWILIHIADKNSAIILEVAPTKDNVEIVNWHYIDESALRQKKNQAIKEGGLLLTLSKDNAAGNTVNDSSVQSIQTIAEGGHILTLESVTANTRDALSSADKDSNNSDNEDLISMARRIAKEEKAKRETKAKKWEDMNAQERADQAKNDPLSEEDIKGWDGDEVIKANALAYLDGDSGIIPTLAYLKIYENVRNRIGDSEKSNETESEGKLARGTNQSSTERGSRRRDGGQTQPMAEQNSEGKVSGSGERNREDSERGASERDGGSGTREVRTLPSGVRVRDTDGNGISGSSVSSGGGSAISREGETGQSNGHSDRARGRRDTRSNRRGDESNNRDTSRGVDQDLNDALGEFKDILGQFVKAGLGESSLSLIGLNARQIELLPSIASSGAKVGYQLLRKGIRDFKAWAAKIKDMIGNLLKSAGFVDDDIDRFIEEMWNCRLPMNGEVHTIAEWSKEMTRAELRREISRSIEEKLALQREAESIEVKNCDRENIDKTLPFLYPEQRDDVYKAEVQMFSDEHRDAAHGYGNGILFTNGTGTGKTYTGLGIAKRFIKQGKGRVLIITPSQTKVSDWVTDASNLGIKLNPLVEKDGKGATMDKGEGAVITTFANFRANQALLEDTFDLVIYDESHRLMESRKANETVASVKHYQITNHDFFTTLQRLKLGHSLWREEERLRSEEKALLRKYREATPDDFLNNLNPSSAEKARISKIESRLKDIKTEQEEVLPKLKEQASAITGHTKTVFLSATPFNTRHNLDYAEGYIFSYTDNPISKYETEKEREAARAALRNSFYTETFPSGEQIKNGQLVENITEPDRLGTEERAFTDKLVAQGSMVGRTLENGYDYSRDFPTITIGNAEQFNEAVRTLEADSSLAPGYEKVFGDYNTMSVIYETMKVGAIEQRLKEHLALGRQVVIFHRRVNDNKNVAQPPFALALQKAIEAADPKLRETVVNRARLFSFKYKDLLKWEQTLDYRMPRAQISSILGDTHMYTPDEMSSLNMAVEEYLSVLNFLKPIPEAKLKEVGTILGNVTFDIEDLDIVDSVCPGQNEDEDKEAYRKRIKDAVKRIDIVKAAMLARLKERDKAGEIDLKLDDKGKKVRSIGLVAGADTNADKKKDIERFQNDDDPMRVIVVQEDSGKEGISLHDKTGKHMRVEINLALPQSPISFIQQEGRIYRLGQKSNAIFEYPLLGIDNELKIFAGRFNQQASTTENLALGSRARGLRKSISRGVLSRRGVVPVQSQGLGGKDFDKADENRKHGYDAAVEDYEKEKDKIIRGETPAPLAFKMVESAGLSEGDKVLEPSAGRGIIIRYIPSGVRSTSIEPETELSNELMLSSGGVPYDAPNSAARMSRVFTGKFEDFSTVNKFDATIMAPPEGKEQDHIRKALQHMEPGSRIVALVSEKVADGVERLVSFEDSAKVTSEVKLPAFFTDGSAKRIIVIDVARDSASAEKLAKADMLDLSKETDETRLLEKIGKIDLPKRTPDITAKWKKMGETFASAILADGGIISKGKYRVDYGGVRFTHNSSAFRGLRWRLPDQTRITISTYLDFYRIKDLDSDILKMYTTFRKVLEMNATDAVKAKEELTDSSYGSKVADKTYSQLITYAKAFTKLVERITGLSEDRLARAARGEAIDLNEKMESGKSYSSKELSELFHITAGEDIELIDMFDRVMKPLKEVGISGVTYSEPRSNTFAYFSMNDNKLHINSSVWNRSKIIDERGDDVTLTNAKRAEVICHELIHAVSAYAIRYLNYPSEYRNMKLWEEANRADDLYSTIMSNPKVYMLPYYCKTNVDELFAEMASPAVRRVLQTIPIWKRTDMVGSPARYRNPDPRVANPASMACSSTSAYNAMEEILQGIINNFDRPLFELYANAVNSGKFTQPHYEAVAFDRDNDDLNEVNQRFNDELQQQIDGSLPSGHVYSLGRPCGFLQAAGIPDLPIELPASQLEYKATSGKHDFDLHEVMGLPQAINNPIATFEYGDKKKSQNILTMISHNGENFIVGMFIKPTVNGKVLEVNSVRNVFPKNGESIVRWINQGKLTNTNKKELLNFLDQQRTNHADVASVLPDGQVKQRNAEVSSATKVVENFENPTLREEETRFRTTDAPRSMGKKETNSVVDKATAFVTGKPLSEVRKERQQRERAWIKETIGLYEKILSGEINAVTLSRIYKHLDESTPKNPFGRPLYKRLPSRVGQALYGGQRTNAIDAFLSRAAERAVPYANRKSEEGRRRIEEAKKRALRSYAKTAGIWYESLDDIPGISTATEVDHGTASRVFFTADGQSVIKINHGKPFGKRFRPDIDEFALFNAVFPNTQYEIIGYCDLGEGVSTIVRQPAVHAGSEAVSESERVAYMASLGFKPINEGNTAFSNGTIIASDIQKKNIVKDTSGNIRVIDADMKLHTRDVGGEYDYPAVEEDVSLTDTDEQGSSEDVLFRDNDVNGEETRFRITDEILAEQNKRSEEHKEYIKKAQAESKRLGAKLKVYNNEGELPWNARELERKRPGSVKAWYNDSTGEICVYTPNCTNELDAYKSVWHEIVAHKGLRTLLGKDGYDALCDDVWKGMSRDARWRKLNYAFKTMSSGQLRRILGDNIPQDFKAMSPLQVAVFASDEYVRRFVADEYIADLAEGGDFEDSAWKRFKLAVRELLRRLGYNLRFTDGDIADVLRGSYNNLQTLAREVEDTDLEEVNRRFNEELMRWASGEMNTNEQIIINGHLGVLSSFIPDLPILLRQLVLRKSANKHGLSASKLENLPLSLSRPIFIFKRDGESISVLTELQDEDGRNIFVALQLGVNKQLGSKFLDVNDISTIHGREVENIVRPILENGTLVWADKEKGLSWLSSAKSNSQAITDQDLSSATKVVENFENPTHREENNNAYRLRMVYHGSGADFDHFDHHFMGSGEGAQTYGWGTYVSEVEGISKMYAKTSMKDGKMYLYTVEIPDDKGDNYIDWDKVVTPSQAQKIENVLRPWGIPIHAEGENGEYVYEYLVDKFGRGEHDAADKQKASDFLSSLGFTGIRMPAQYRSGGRKDGAKNYVIFKESDAEILSKRQAGIMTNIEKLDDGLEYNVEKQVDFDGKSKITRATHGNKNIGLCRIRLYDEEGRLIKMSTYKDGKHDGLYTEWYENGRKQVECTYKDGKYDGLYTEWYENGQKQVECTYKDDKRIGPYTSWYENGQKQVECTYKDDKRIGPYTGWYNNGQRWFECTYKDGKPDGLYTKWDESGQKQVECTYKDGKYDGLYTEWDENGQKQFECTYKDDKYDGLYTEWDENGQKFAERTYKDGKLDGPYTSWYENGQKKYERTYKDGKLDGLYTEWYENGRKQVECTYKDDKYDGPYTKWDENGQKQVECTYKDCVYDGLYTKWYKNGQKQVERTSKDGKLDGPYTEWYENGQKQVECTFKDGKLDGPYTEWYENGQKQFECTYKDDEIISNDSTRFRIEDVDEVNEELEDIVRSAKSDGTFMKAPNGKPSNLTERQWAQVRTKAFKNWFGDWEKSARIEKLRKSEPISITGKEIELNGDDIQNKKAASEYGRTLQGLYINADTGVSISLQRGRRNGGVNEVLQHNYKDKAHLQSVAAIPQIIEKSIFVDEVQNLDKDKNPNVSSYQHFVCGLKIDKEDYTVHAIVAVDRGGNRYYDHNLSYISKEKLLDLIDRGEAVSEKGFGTMPDTKSTTNSAYKDRLLYQLLQTNSSKFIDENGEPKVFYHNTPNTFTIFDEGHNGTNNDSGWLGDGFYFYGDINEGDGYGNHKMSVFLNVHSPYYASSEENNRLAEANNREDSIDFRNEVEDEGYDGVYYNGDLRQEAVVFYSNQIKSATDNNGNFSTEDDDIRFRIEDNDEVNGRLLTEMEQNATTQPLLELTPENWIKEFGEDGKVRTPIGEVKLGKHQYQKLIDRKRSNEFGMIRPTLNDPDIIIEKTAETEGAERNSKYLFVKTFKKSDGSRYVHYESVTIRRDGLEVSISSHEADRNAIEKEMQNGEILHLRKGLSADSERYLTSTPKKKGPDLVPTSNDTNVVNEFENPTLQEEETRFRSTDALHDRVGREGLEGVLGNENLSRFCMDAYSEMPIVEREHVVRRAELLGWNFAKAVQKYLAEVAEDNSESKALDEFWKQIGKSLEGALNKTGVEVNNLSRRDLQWLMWQSYNAGQDNDNILAQAKRAVIAGRLGFDAKSKQMRSDVQKNMKLDDASNRFSTIATDSILGHDREDDTRFRADDVNSKAERIEKLRRSEPIEATGIEYEGKYELNSKAAGKYILSKLRGEYVNEDTNERVNITRKSEKVTHHDAESEIHLKSIALIPQMIERSIYIDEESNEKGKNGFETYRYYVVGLRIAGEDYTAKLVIGVKNGQSYYDHALTKIEKGNLIDNIGLIKRRHDNNEESLSDIKDKRLLSLLQTKSTSDTDTRFRADDVNSKAERIEKLRRSEPIEATGIEYEGKYELSNKSASKFIIDSLRGEYINDDTGHVIRISRRGAEKVTRHDAESEIHLKSIALIPQMIERSIYIDEESNEKGKNGFETYRYYVVGLRIAGEDYTAKLVIGVKNGQSYYDHALTKIEKGNLINQIDRVKADVYDNETALSDIKDKRLLSLLQTKSTSDTDTRFRADDDYRKTNVVNGIEAIKRISEGADEVKNAMHREDLKEYGGESGITFIFGKTGDSKKNFKGGFGLAHIGAKHGKDTILKLLDVIANGRIERYVEGNKTIVLEKDGYQALLALTRFGNRETWLFNGWEKKETKDENGEVSATSTSTQVNPTFSREDLGALVSSVSETDITKVAQNSVISSDTDTRFRVSADNGGNTLASDVYNRAVASVNSRQREVWLNQFEAVDKLVEAIEKSSGKKAESFEDVRLALNQQSSEGLAAMQDWERKYWTPLGDAVKELIRSSGRSLEEIERYLMLKHGLERNVVFAKRDAKESYQTERDKKVEAIKANDALTSEEKKAKIGAEDKALERHLSDVEAGTDAKYKSNRKNDYSGLTEMYMNETHIDPFDETRESREAYLKRWKDSRTPKYTSVSDMEAAATSEVNDFESKNSEQTDALWKAINGATTTTLKYQYDHNLISAEQYKRVRDMFKYYVPLRGFSDTTAEDLYSYYSNREGGNGGYTAPLLNAKGRKSKAVSPLGTIAGMAESAISSGVKNSSKLALYSFISNRANNDLVTISEVWYEKAYDEYGNPIVNDDGKQVFKPVFPTFDEELSAQGAKEALVRWEQAMQEKAKNGDAFKGRKGLKLDYTIIAGRDERNAHVIRFKLLGRDMMVYVNGNPRAAQAINGEFNLEGAKDYQKVFGPVLRYMSAINTSYNPEFWLSNLQRDLLFSINSTFVKEDSRYVGPFLKNIFRASKVVKFNGRLAKGTLGDSNLEKLYKEFVANGAVTGYTSLKGIEEWEQALRKHTGDELRAVKQMKKFFEGIQRFGESIEQMTRFAAFITSRENGRGIRESVADAKELTVNFNRKGSGRSITWDETAKLRTKDGKPLSLAGRLMAMGFSLLPAYGRRYIMFFNAAVQGLNTKVQLYKKSPLKAASLDAMLIAFGAVNAIIHAMFDDDDDYLDIPDFQRRTNLLVGSGGVYFKWALPQESRVFYGMGDMLVNHALGREPHKDSVAGVLSEVGEMIADVMPLNPVDGASSLAPSMLTPFVEVVTNRDYRGAKVYNDLKYLSDEERKRTPKYKNAYSGTSRVFIEASELLNELSGGDYADAGAINFSPEIAEHLFEGYTGGLGTTIAKTYKASLGQIFGEDFKISTTPFVSRLVVANDDRSRDAHISDLFNYYKAEAEHTRILMKRYAKDGESEKLSRLVNSPDFEVMAIYRSYKSWMDNYNKQLRLTGDKSERRELMREQDNVRKQMIDKISQIQQ